MPEPLYNRYIPPKAKKTVPAVIESPNHEDASSHASKKRKHDGKDSKKAKKSRRDVNGDFGRSDANAQAAAEETGSRVTKVVLHKKPKALSPSTTGGAVDSQPEDFTTDGGQQQVDLRDNSERRDGSAAEQPEQELPEPKRKKKKRKKEAANTDETALDHEELPSAPVKHSGILSKYEKATRSEGAAMEVQSNGEEEQEIQEPEAPEPVLHDLVPIPIPRREAQGPAFAASAALPSWLSHYTAVGRDASSSFKDLHVSTDLLKRLKKKGFERALPVQSAVLPLLLPIRTQHPGDLCVSAVTGSGKTLAYCLPVVQDLVRQPSQHLRAVIVVPTRELVTQVHDVLDMCATGTSIRIGAATGSQRIEQEQAEFIGERTRLDIDAALRKQQDVPLTATHAADLNTSNVSEDEDDEDDDRLLDVEAMLKPQMIVPPNHIREYYSKVDVLITTPGRLVDHIHQTKGFNLQKLEWLVIDEADRLLDASFQEWVETVNKALIVPKPVYSDPYTAGLLATGPIWRLKKVLLSATMTRDLSKLAELKLHNPKLVVVESSERAESGQDTKQQIGGVLELPSRLTEYGVPVGDGSEKPLYLLALLKDIIDGRTRRDMQGGHQTNGMKPTTNGHTKESSDDSDASSVLSESSDSSASSSPAHRQDLELADSEPGNALVFASSTESANRLSRLLAHLHPKYAGLTATLTKSATSSSGSKAISRFQTGKCRILISTDRVARGLDLANLTNVINYDIPHSITSYVHRVGRTARAERAGTAWTLLEDKQARWFWKTIAPANEIKRSDGAVVARHRVDVEALGEDAKVRYVEALRELEQDVKKSSRKQ